jgi:hypothetical protein
LINMDASFYSVPSIGRCIRVYIRKSYFVFSFSIFASPSGK